MPNLGALFLLLLSATVEGVGQQEQGPLSSRKRVVWCLCGLSFNPDSSSSQSWSEGGVQAEAGALMLGQEHPDWGRSTGAPGSPRAMLWIKTATHAGGKLDKRDNHPRKHSLCTQSLGAWLCSGTAIIVGPVPALYHFSYY